MKLFIYTTCCLFFFACNNNNTSVTELTVAAIDSASRQAIADTSNKDALAISGSSNYFNYVINADTVPSATETFTLHTAPATGFTAVSKKINNQYIQLVVNTSTTGRYSFNDSDTATVRGFFWPSPKNKKEVYRFLTGTVTLVQYNNKGVYYLRFEGVAANTLKNKVMITGGSMLYTSP
jgi:hypothetical protein